MTEDSLPDSIHSCRGMASLHETQPLVLTGPPADKAVAEETVRRSVDAKGHMISSWSRFGREQWS